MSQRRSALGRGLGALISNPATRPGAAPAADASRAPAAVGPESTHSGVNTIMSKSDGASSVPGPQMIDITLIDPNPEQPRREFEPKALAELARSIGQHGVLQPVVVRRAGPRFELVMGERRFRATQLAGRTTIPAVVSDIEPADRLELAIVENVQRQDLNPIELAHAYRALAEAGNTQDEIGRKVAIDRSSVANHLRLLDLSRDIQSDIESNKLSMGHAKALLQVQDLEAREALRGRILREGLSVRAAEQAAREAAGTPTRKRAPSSTPAAPALDADTRAFVERIERSLQTHVTLRPNADGSGRIEIKYFNLEDLERLGARMLGG